LAGRVMPPNWSGGCTTSPSTRGDTTDFHGPLQRLLGGDSDGLRYACGTIRVGLYVGNYAIHKILEVIVCGASDQPFEIVANAREWRCQLHFAGSRYGPLRELGVTEQFQQLRFES